MQGKLICASEQQYFSGYGMYYYALRLNSSGISCVLSSDGKSSNYARIRFSYEPAPQNTIIRPETDRYGNIGTASYRWNQFYAANSSIVTSDQNLKCNISYIGKSSDYDNTYMSDDTLTEFVMGLLPCIFNRIDGESGRPHHDFISQDIEELLKRLGIKDHAGFIKSPKTKDVEVEREVEEEITNEDGTVEIVKKTVKEIVQEEIPGEYVYSLRYEEFIPDNVRFSQILYEKIEEQAEIIQQQQQEIEELKNRMARLEALVLD